MGARWHPEPKSIVSVRAYPQHQGKALLERDITSRYTPRPFCICNRQVIHVQAHLSAEEAAPCPHARLPRPYGDQGWPRGDRASSRQGPQAPRSEEHTSELQSLMRISYAAFCLKKKKESHHTTN